jgi:hypothetical protein
LVVAAVLEIILLVVLEDQGVGVMVVTQPLAAQESRDKVLLVQQALFKEAEPEAVVVAAQVLRLFLALVQAVLGLVVMQAQEQFLL